MIAKEGSHDQVMIPSRECAKGDCIGRKTVEAKEGHGASETSDGAVVWLFSGDRAKTEAHKRREKGRSGVRLPGLAEANGDYVRGGDKYATCESSGGRREKGDVDQGKRYRERGNFTKSGHVVDEGEGCAAMYGGKKAKVI